MIFIDQPLRILALALLIGRFIYWTYEEYRSYKEKPASQSFSIMILLKRFVVILCHLLLCLQLIGLTLLPYQNSLSNKLLGIVFIIMATIISYVARRELGNNWAPAAAYQIKKDQQLVTSGIYSYIRHPIYLGVVLTFLGVELIVGSYLVLLFMIIVPWVAYIQSKKEEKILIEHFGQQYKEYQKKTFLFLPYLL